MARKSRERIEIEARIRVLTDEFQEHLLAYEIRRQKAEACEKEILVLQGILNRAKGDDEQQPEGDG